MQIKNTNMKMNTSNEQREFDVDKSVVLNEFTPSNINE